LTSKRVLVFDFDGTLIDTESLEYETWRASFDDFGQTLELKDWLPIIGGAVSVDMWTVLEQRLGHPVPHWQHAEQRRLERHAKAYEHLPLMPGVQRLFDEAAKRKIPIGVASNSTQGWVERGLIKTGLRDQVRSIRARDTASKPKPDPAPYAEAVAELGGDPARSFAFEDSATGVASAKAAGLTVIAIPNALTQHHDLSAAHRIVASLEHFQLPD
jgi:HAD superfamily hydrolase (TIGR01509 family)